MKKYYLFFLAVFCFALFFQTSCSTVDVFNIVGTWNFILVYENSDAYSGSMTFVGSETQGTVYDYIIGITGSYEVDGDFVDFYMVHDNEDPTQYSYWLGRFSDKNNMSGDYSDTTGWTGTWTASR